jgi:hypothetical protein
MAVSNGDNFVWQMVRYRSHRRWRRAVDHERKRYSGRSVLSRTPLISIY